MFKFLTKFVQSTQSSHIVRRRRVGELVAPRARIPLAYRCPRALRGNPLALADLSVKNRPRDPGELSEGHKVFDTS
eukprot:7092248-Pyramimonas_sp.AAC.1